VVHDHIIITISTCLAAYMDSKGFDVRRDQYTSESPLPNRRLLTLEAACYKSD